MLRRVDERMASSGVFKAPAVPALLDEYVALCRQAFSASARAFSAEELETARALLAQRLAEAFAGSQRSKVAVSFLAEAGRPLGYEVHAEISSIADAYGRWVGTSEAPLFGSHADARVEAVAATLGAPEESPVLDLGAGTGRNAFALSRRGHPLDAVEITAQFAEILKAQALREGLPIRVVVCNVFEDARELRRDYRLFLASEVVPDFRNVAELRALFELAATVLEEGGALVFNLHLAAPDYTPERAAREFAQQCYSALFTPSEVSSAAAGLPFELQSDDSVHDYERLHLSAAAWPPTPWYVNWVSGLDVYALEAEPPPIELRWLVYRKVGEARPQLPPNQGRRWGQRDSGRLRSALVRRFKRRAVASGEWTLPAVPALRDHYVARCFGMFSALGRELTAAELGEGSRLFGRALDAAFAASPRSNVVVSYEMPMGSDVTYTVTADPVPLAEAYEQWLEGSPELFGSHPDARLVSLLASLGEAAGGTALDVGAGLGRNTLYLARRGFSVDAVDLTPAFCAKLEAAVVTEQLPVRVLCEDIRNVGAKLRATYRLVVLSGVAGDFRDKDQLADAFRLAEARLENGGTLLLNLHLAVAGYAPEPAALQWAQQCCAMLYTREQLAEILAPLALELVSDDDAHAFEQEHLPAAAWPPTPAFSEWALGQHMYALAPDATPIELRWLVFRRRARPNG